MRSIDFAPLYRSTIGFDRLFSMLDNMSPAEGAQSYPPYNIERTGENAYRISMAVAGFGEDDLTIEAKEHTLTVENHPPSVYEAGLYHPPGVSNDDVCHMHLSNRLCADKERDNPGCNIYTCHGVAFPLVA